MNHGNIAVLRPVFTDSAILLSTISAMFIFVLALIGLVYSYWLVNLDHMIIMAGRMLTFSHLQAGDLGVHIARLW